MRRVFRSLLLPLFVCGPAALAAQQPPAPQTLTAFDDAEGIIAWLADLEERRCGGAPAVSVTRGVVRDDGARIVGRVFDSLSGDAQPQLRVELAPVRIAATTDADGRFAMGLPADQLRRRQDYTLRARQIGGAREVRLTIAAGDSVTVEVPLCAEQLQLEALIVTGSKMAAPQAASALAERSESITNVQHAGADEGGIVKLHGDHLVVLRRGRLFTVDIGGDRLAPVSTVHAYGPGIDARGTWYDELLVTDGHVLVIGYSYQRGGTEIGVFRIDGRGRLQHRSTYQLRSNDYYSSRNYASRLVDGRLVFYAPLMLRLGRHDARELEEMLPALRRWDPARPDDGFVSIASPASIYRPARDVAARHDVALHTVTSCAIADGELDCQATGVFGPFGHTFYVSPRAVYVWLTEWRRGPDSPRPSMVYRLPLSAAAPTALGVRGSPIDQFSFLESDDDHLNVLVTEGAGQWMWSPERRQGRLELLRVPLAGFGDGRRDADPAAYRELPPVSGGRALQNRFVGEHLLIGAGAGWWWPDDADEAALIVVNWRTGARRTLRTAHPVDRLEPLGGDALVIGADADDLHFTTLSLARQPRLVHTVTLPGANQGETRSHGFFYRADGSGGGLLGLPVRGSGRPGYEHLVAGSASIVFMRNDALRLRQLGSLAAQAPARARDGCVASCVDWYGNARPLFIGGRVLALLGYELVEGALRDGAITERRRTLFEPRYANAFEP